MNGAGILSFLVGTWFICSTDFPMWTTGRKTDPQFHYSLTEKKGEQVLGDLVTYQKKGRSKTINGYDGLQKDSSFVWRGKGILFLLKSKWKVALKDPEGNWAVIYFSKTLFTPEGTDIIFRTTNPDSVVLAGIKKQMEEIPELKKHVQKLKDIR